MSENDFNPQVMQLLDSIQDVSKYLPTDDEKALLRKYDECDDYHISNSLITKMWDYISHVFPEIDSIYGGYPVQVMHTNGGQGKVLEKCPHNAVIQNYSQDYTCKTISDLLCAHRTVGREITYSSEVFDISQFFIGGNSMNNPHYDVIIYQSVKTDYYKTLDRGVYGHLPYYAYYTLRSLEFLVEGGYICIFCTEYEASKITTMDEIKNEVKVRKVLKTNSSDDHNCLIIQKKNGR